MLLMVGAVVVGFAGTARAQSGYSMIPEHKFEITVGGGYVWTFSKSAYLPPPGGTGSVDIKDSGYWDVALDFTLAGSGGPQVAQLELLFRQQPGTEVQFKQNGIITDSQDMDVNYYQIGGLGGIPRGKALPFATFSLGATQYHFKSSNLDDSWRFSMIFGLGAKYYASEKMGIRIQANLPFTWFSSNAGVACPPCSYYYSGTGVWQIDVGGGLFLNFGG
jgi:hypothetical protein